MTLSMSKRGTGLARGMDISFFKPKKVFAKYGWTQNQLAGRLGINSASLSQIVNGNPSIAQVKAMADAIGCSFIEFFDLQPEESELASNQIQCPSCGTVLTFS